MLRNPRPGHGFHPFVLLPRRPARPTSGVCRVTGTRVKKQPRATLESPPDTGEKPSEAQRRRIVAALGKCIRSKGYAACTLTDIAITAGMSPSLMRYYFSTKEDILEIYYDRFSERILSDILKIPRTTPTQWIGDFCTYSIGAGTERAALALLIETFAVAMHHEGLSRLKRRYDSFMARIYVEFFQWAGTVHGIDAHEAARIARALELGIKLGAVFQHDFDAEAAEFTFRSEMYRLSGLGGRL